MTGDHDGGDERVDAFLNVLTKVAASKLRTMPPKSLVGHTRHCLTTVALKQASLQTALQVLQRQVWPALVKGLCHGNDDNMRNKSSSSSFNDKDDNLEEPLTIPKEHVPKVLEHIFTQILRLHDALILLVSGECRHKGDRNARKPFPTRLTTNATRADGYTQLYKSSSVYSGASMDEWNDERNGLQQAWRDFLGPTLWERLLEKHAIVEALLTDLDTQMQQLQQDFSSVTSRIVHGLQQVFPQKRVKLSLADQMEILTVDPWSWERRGKAFQWNHRLGVLPQGWTATQWYKSLAWEPPPPAVAAAPRPAGTRNPPSKKRRRVILDDDDDVGQEDDQRDSKPAAPTKLKPHVVAKENEAQPKAQGLRVTTKKTRDNSEKVDSLNQIKAQMGVNVQALQQAREGLEAEEAATRNEANAIDEAPPHVENDDEQRRNECVRRVMRLSKQLKRIEGRLPVDMYDLWDARECLRQALMEAGNVHLWSDLSKTDDGERHNVLRTSGDFFGQALNLVKQQKELHGKMVAAMSHSEELRMCWRNLLLLQAQAFVNRGVALIESGQRKAPEAIRYLDEAQKECRALQKTAEKDRTNGASALETSLDSLHARETETLAVRWKAEAHWKMGRQKEAIATFSKAGSAHNQDNIISVPMKRDKEILRAFVSVRTESYYAWTRLIDLQAEEAQRAPQSHRSQEKWKTIENALHTAFAGAVSCSRALELDIIQCGDMLHSFFKDHDVLSAQDLLSAEKTLMDNIKYRREAVSKSLSKDKEAQRQHVVPRSDVTDNGLGQSNVSSRWLLTGSSETANSRRRKRYGAGYSNIRVSAGPIEKESQPVQASARQRFRKWGDDFFPKKKNEKGEFVPDFPYPYCAPEMPAHIRAVLEKKGVLGRQ